MGKRLTKIYPRTGAGPARSFFELGAELSLPGQTRVGGPAPCAAVMSVRPASSAWFVT